MVEPGKSYSVAEAAELLGKFPKAKFDESIEIAFKMTIDPRKTDQMIRGTVRLPHGSGKEVKVLNEGQYFGEIALMYDVNRQATVQASKGSKILEMSRVTFQRLLGPLSVILKRDMEDYEDESQSMMNAIKASK